MIAAPMRHALEPALLDLSDHAALLEVNNAMDLLPAYRRQVTALRAVARQHHMSGVDYVGMLLDDGLSRLAALRRALTDDERAALADWPALLMADLFGSTPDADPQGTWAVLRCMRRHPWFPELPEYFWHVIETRLSEDARALGADGVPPPPAVDMLPEPFPDLPAETVPAEDPDDDHIGRERFDDTVPSEAGNVVATEELQALSDAVGALQEDSVVLLEDVIVSPDRDEAFELYTEQLSNLVGAARVVGLGGFQQVLELILANTTALRMSGAPVSAVQRALLTRWPPVAVAYLAVPGDLVAAQALVALAEDPAWPYPAHPDDLPGWLVAMQQVQVVDTRPTSARATVALPEDVDLQVPRDIERNVLDSLLEELPQQAHDFSMLVQQLVKGGTLEQLEHARRVAHTLKGAGNTVGVKGVANLTHALEDILAAFGREQRLPTPDLADTLIEAADCLEAMSEALLAGHTWLPGGLAVHQKVLDWANQIDREGLPPEPVADELIGVELPVTEVVGELPRPDADLLNGVGEGVVDDSDPLLRVPTSLIDSLLKLVGQNAILSSQIQDHVARLGHELGALRSDSRQFSKLSYELEQLVDVRGGAMLSGRQGVFDALEMDQYNDLHMLSRRIVESDADSREFTRAFEREVNSLRDLLAEKEQVQLEVQRKILRTRMVEVNSIAPRLQRSVRQTARVLGRPVQLEIQGLQTLVDGQLLQRLLDPLMHLLRNAVDHGIEPASERLSIGKPETGVITLRFNTQGTNLLVSCSDDGRGLNLAAIRNKAVRAGLIASTAILSDEQVLRLILLPGFSTRDHATQVSGRGVGMDVVQRAVIDLRGTLEIHSDSGLGACFDMMFPVQLSSTQVMITRSARHTLAISVRGVDQILPLGDELTVQPDGRTTYRLQDALFGIPLKALRLETLLGLPTYAFRQPGALEVVMIVRDENRQRHALVVPELRDSRNVVVKPLNALIPHVLGVDGATILGDGSVAMVLDLPDLMRGHGDTAISMFTGMPARELQAHPLRCLIVDDSISVRQAMEQLVHDAGYEVSTARDGLDALGTVRRSRPDILLVDLEMPRMNGLELTAALRNDSATRDLPIVMITSRFTDKHHQLAVEAGVDAFLTKPYSEDHLLSIMERLIPKAVAA